MNVSNNLRIFLAASIIIGLSACGGGDSEQAPTLNKISLMSLESSYIEGMQDDIYVSATYSDGHSASISGVQWTTSHPEVATVNANNVLIALSPGIVNIAASYQGIEANSEIEITAAMLTQLEVLADQHQVPAGLTQQLSAWGTFNNGKSTALTSLNWNSSDESIAVVDDLGMVKTLSAGQVQITALAEDISNQIQITVTPAELTLLNIAMDSTSVPAGYKLVASAIGIYTDQSTHTIGVNWSSSDVNVFAVDADGQVSGLSLGTAQLIAEMDGVESAPIAITVTDAVAVSLEITPTLLSIPLGLTEKPQATLLFSDGNTQSASNLVWSSHDESIVLVDENGIISTVSKGETQISAVSEGHSASLTVKVTDAVVTGIDIISASYSIPAGLTQKNQLIAAMSDGPSQNVTQNASWSVSSNLGVFGAPNVDDVIFTAGNILGAGTISASYLNMSTQINIAVTAAIPVGLIDMPTEIVKVPLGLSHDVNFNVEYSDGSTNSPTANVAWHISDTNVGNLTADGSSIANISGKVLGNFILKAEYGEWSFDIPVEITAALPLEMTLNSLELYADDEPVQMIATMTYTDGSTQNASDIVLWSSSNNNIAAISNAAGEQGKVTVVTQGEAIVSASFNGNEISAFASVVIHQPRLLAGFMIHDYAASNTVTIGEGDYAVTLNFSSANADLIHFYNSSNAGVGLSNGANSIADISDASAFGMTYNIVDPQVNSSLSVAMAKNWGNYYTVVQVHEVRSSNHDGKLDVVAFSWAIRTDGGTDFSKFIQQPQTKLLKCSEPDFFGNNGGCVETAMSYSTVASSSISQLPRPSEFKLGDYTLISLGQDITVTNVIAKDGNNIVSPYFSGLYNDHMLPAGHSVPFTLQIPATSGQTAMPSFTFDIDNNASKSFSYSGSFSSN